MRNLSFWVLASFVAIITSCSVEPEPVSYGEDQCDFCKMGVVDKAHSAQYVTQKGKQYKFDAIECLINELKDPELVESDLAFILVADYSAPGTMIDASTATYIISKSIKSPMGAYLSAFSKAADAEATVTESGGVVYDWAGIKAEINKK